MGSDQNRPDNVADAGRIARRNTAVNLEQFHAAGEAIDQLRHLGLRPRGYEVRSPYDSTARKPRADQR